MVIFGYARVNSEGGYNGRQTDIFMFGDKQARDIVMYDHYVSEFQSAANEYEFGADEYGNRCDSNGTTMMTREEFLSEIEKSDNVENDVFGLIQLPNSHIQFEPFLRML